MFIAPYAPELNPAMPVVPRPPSGMSKVDSSQSGSSSEMKVSN